MEAIGFPALPLDAIIASFRAFFFEDMTAISSSSPSSTSSTGCDLAFIVVSSIILDCQSSVNSTPSVPDESNSPSSFFVSAKASSNNSSNSSFVSTDRLSSEATFFSLNRSPSSIASFSETAAVARILATRASPTKSCSALYFVSFIVLSSTISNLVNLFEAFSTGKRERSKIFML